MSIYLYLKQHNITGLKYLGQTSKDPFDYKGSGKHWKLHISKHGYDVSTTILYETPYMEEISEQGLYYSDLWNIVGSPEFANLKPESGEGGIHSGEIIAKIAAGNKGRTHSEEAKAKISAANKGKTLSDETKTKISASKLKMSDETKAKMSVALKGRQQPKATCPHCGKTGGERSMKRYHFDNCKSSPE